MRVVELEARQVRVPLVRAVRHASHARSASDNLVVRCVLSDKSVGWGEGVPREYVTGETIDSALGLLARSDLPRQLTPCHTFAQAVELAERLTLAPVPGDDRGCGGNAARCAAELAILDAFGRACGEPLMNVTKLLAPNLYAPRPQVRYSAAITGAKRLKLRLAPLAMRLLGFEQVKVKVGIAGFDDVRRLRAVRRWAGSRMDLRLDANEAWTPAEAEARIAALEPFGISSVEQPVPHELVAALADLRKRIKASIMLDESLCSMTDAERAANGGWCDTFNLRLSKCGGFIPTLKLALFADARGLGTQLGCQVGETGILSAAGRHFATSVAGLKHLEGSYDRHLVRTPLTADDITFGRGGLAPALIGSGLGVAVDPAAVDAATVRREVLIAP
jgi:muconate cycloisomerase